MTWDDRTTRCVSGLLVRRADDGPRVAVDQMALTVVAGPDAGKRFEVAGPIVRIGTSAAAHVHLTDDTVSRQHCEISMRESRYVVRDLGSTNGTSIDGVLVVEAYVTPGCRVRTGVTEMIFEGERSWAPVASSKATSFGGLVGTSDVMQGVFGVLEQVAPTELSVLLIGETGTGKGAAARTIHEASARRTGPFVIVDCAALSRTLVESQLFGHERGAFTGADKSRKGAFERAQGGTVFLDEIGELPLDLQPKLLRVLERREVEPLGASSPSDVDVRIVAATHRDLGALVASSAFREDLFYRLAEIVVELPPLRERRADIGPLARRLLEESRDTATRSISEAAVSWLAQREFRGNVRELRNFIRRAAVLAPGPVLEPASFEMTERMGQRGGSVPPPPPSPSGAAEAVLVHAELPIKAARDRWIAALERRYFETLVSRFGEDVDAIAAHVGLHRKSVFRLLREHGLSQTDPID